MIFESTLSNPFFVGGVFTVTYICILVAIILIILKYRIAAVLFGSVTFIIMSIVISSIILVNLDSDTWAWLVIKVCVIGLAIGLCIYIVWQIVRYIAKKRSIVKGDKHHSYHLELSILLSGIVVFVLSTNGLIVFQILANKSSKPPVIPPPINPKPPVIPPPIKPKPPKPNSDKVNEGSKIPPAKPKPAVIKPKPPLIKPKLLPAKPKPPPIKPKPPKTNTDNVNEGSIIPPITSEGKDESNVIQSQPSGDEADVGRSSEKDDSSTVEITPDFFKIGSERETTPAVPVYGHYNRPPIVAEHFVHGPADIHVPIVETTPPPEGKTYIMFHPKLAGDIQTMFRVKNALPDETPLQRIAWAGQELYWYLMSEEQKKYVAWAVSWECLDEFDRILPKPDKRKIYVQNWYSGAIEEEDDPQDTDPPLITLGQLKQLHVKNKTDKAIGSEKKPLNLYMLFYGDFCNVAPMPLEIRETKPRIIPVDIAKLPNEIPISMNDDVTKIER